MQLDLSGRLAPSERIIRVGPEVRVLKLLWANELDDDVRKGALGSYLLATSTQGRVQVPGGRVTAPALWNAWLHADWRLDVTGGLALDVLLGWAAIDQNGARFVEKMAEPVAAGVRDG